MTASPLGSPAGPQPAAGPSDKAILGLLPFDRRRDADPALWTHLYRHARCADSIQDADQWFPLSAEGDRARREAADAIVVCLSCPVRTLCLALSVRHWDIGKYGIWGGLTAADRAALRHQLLASGPAGKPGLDGPADPRAHGTAGVA